MIRFGQKTIIFLLNNGGYTIEVEIHDGPYNIIKNWNYTALVEAFANGEGNLWTCKVRCSLLVDTLISHNGWIVISLRTSVRILGSGRNLEKRNNKNSFMILT